MHTKPVLAIVAVLAVVAAVVFGSLYFLREPDTKTVTVKPCGEREFGHINALTRKGDHYELRFDPAWFTSGVTANTAAAEDGAVDPGQPVPNDNYIVDESHRLLMYLVPDATPVTVLTREGDPAQFGATPITVSELAEIVANGKSSQRTLFETLDSGVWIRYSIDTVCSLDQQYRP
jgi:hypothetical protein